MAGLIHQMKRVAAAGAAATILAAGTLAASGTGPTASAQAPGYELWVVDQANVANGGDVLYVYTPGSWTEPRELIHLSERAANVGDGPGTRPHLLTFNSTQSHALLANMASGHVYVIRAADRTIVASIDVGAAPDLMELSPSGDLLFVTMRGPRALTGGPSALGTHPGVAILLVENGGASGRRVAFIPIGSQDEGSHADPHALAIRRLTPSR